MGDAVSHTFRQMQNGTGLFYGWFEAMHSRFDLLTVGPTENEAAALCHDIAAEIRRIENRLNRFDEASDVWQINQNTFYDKCPADPELLGIFADALRYREMTGGAFDIAIQTPEYLPGESCFAVDPACEAVVKLRPDAIFDFGGYGKGYALQQALGMLKNAGITTALVNFGNSSVCGIGCHPSGDSWQVGVENPLRRGENMTFFGLNDLCLSSSGNLPSNRGHNRKTGHRQPDRLGSGSVRPRQRGALHRVVRRRCRTAADRPAAFRARARRRDGFHDRRSHDPRSGLNSPFHNSHEFAQVPTASFHRDFILLSN